MRELVEIIYIQFIFALFANLRLTILLKDDKAFKWLRSFLTRQKTVKQELPDGRELEFEEDSKPPRLINLFFRGLLECYWCLPVWIVGVNLTFLYLFPIVTTIFNSFFTVMFLVSWLYEKVKN